LGASEVGADRYPTMVTLHATWLGMLWIFGSKRRVELLCVGLALGMPWHTALFGALNLAMLRHRIRVENAAYAALGAKSAA